MRCYLPNRNPSRNEGPQSADRSSGETISGYYYAAELGPGSTPRAHRVGQDKCCTCNLGADCPAVQAVADYLKAGGERAAF
jgi:hypothetical protein